ncbi:MAG TPA: hypothetical protein VFO17_08870, partial [Acidimicrobiia bacterium]|nr:hypothetical protein [Acidimicrobiia bacterium]
MRIAWFAATAQKYAPYLGLAMLAVVAADWITRFDSGLLVAAGLTGVFLLLLAVRALTVKISAWDASRAAERGLSARDALTTALEFDDPDDELHQVIQDRADRIATESNASQAIPIGVDRYGLGRFGAATALALVLAILPTPFGSSTALSSDLDAALEAEAEQVEKIADAVSEADVETADEIVAELERLAQELRDAESLEQALKSLEDTEKRLGENVDPGFLSQKTAIQGLARDLALRPISEGAALDAASQFETAADSLASLSEQERAALTDRLSDLAASQSVGNPTLSSQLSEAAQALESGDLEAAAGALRQAAAGQMPALEGARGQQALTETQRALEGARARLSGDGQPGDGQ